LANDDTKVQFIFPITEYLLLECSLLLKTHRISDIWEMIWRSFLQIFVLATRKMMCLQWPSSKLSCHFLTRPWLSSFCFVSKLSLAFSPRKSIPKKNIVFKLSSAFACIHFILRKKKKFNKCLHLKMSFKCLSVILSEMDFRMFASSFHRYWNHCWFLVLF